MEANSGKSKRLLIIAAFLSEALKQGSHRCGGIMQSVRLIVNLLPSRDADACF